MNLKNEEFSARILNGDISASNVAFMTPYEMNPDRWRESIEKKVIRDAFNDMCDSYEKGENMARSKKKEPKQDCCCVLGERVALAEEAIDLHDEAIGNLRERLAELEEELSLEDEGE
mgnify:CR=1 FL=1